MGYLKKFDEITTNCLSGIVETKPSQLTRNPKVFLPAGKGGLGITSFSEICKTASVTGTRQDHLLGRYYFNKYGQQHAELRKLERS